MSISPLSSQAYASLLSGLSGSTNSAAGSTTSSGSLGDQLLAELSQSSTSTPSDPLLQELVSLSPAAAGQATTTPQTYTAQGLLQEIQSIQSGMMLNDPLFQTDSTGTSGTNSNSPLQSLLASSQTSTSGSATSSTDALSQALATSGMTDPATLAALFKKDPALVNVYVQSQMNQGVLSMLE